MSEQDHFQKKWRDNELMQRVLDQAFRDAVRKHRAANVPMVMWEDGDVLEVSPFDIPLPEDADDPQQPPPRHPDAEDGY